MADEEKKQSQAPGANEAAPAPASSPVGKILGIVLPAVLAGGAAFGGAKLGQHGGGGHEADAPRKHDEKKQPGLTVELKAFVATVLDEKTGEARPLKMSVAVELEKLATKEQFDPFVPRIRDAVLSYVRNLTYQQVLNPRTKERMTEDLLELIHKIGAEQAQKVLVQEMVTQ